MRWWSWVLSGAAGVFVLYQAFDIAASHGVFQHVPATRDPRLVGRWRAIRWNGSAVELDFRADGTTTTPFLPEAKAWWGTAEGVLYVKQRSAGEGYNLNRAPYAISEGSRVFRRRSGGRSLLIADRMVRRHGAKTHSSPTDVGEE